MQGEGLEVGGEGGKKAVGVFGRQKGRKGK